MEESQALEILRAANFRATEPFHSKMKPWLMECLVCQNIFRRRLRDVINGFGCKYCNNRMTTPNAAAAKMESFGFTPLEPYRTASSKWLVRCHTCGNEIRTSLHGITSGASTGCAICALEKKQQFSIKEPIIFQQIIDLEYTIVGGQRYTGSKKPIQVVCNICSTEASFYPMYLKMKTMKRGCKTCANNALKIDHATYVKRFHDAKLLALETFSSPRESINYRCLVCGFEGQCSAAGLINGRGCFQCGKKRGADKRRFSQSQVSQLFAEVGLDVLESYQTSNQRILSKCRKCEREIRKSYNEVRSHRNGCPYCSEDKVDPVVAIDLIRRRGFEPLEPFPGGRKPWKCECRNCGRVSSPTPTGKLQSPTGCGYCAGNKVDPDEAERFMVGNQIQPLEPYKTSPGLWRCRCMKCSREIMTRYTIVKNGSGCRYCAVQGMNFGAPAFVYLIVHKELDALKIGIGSQELRIRQHTNLGWAVVKVWNFSTGEIASDVEEAVLLHLRSEMGLNHYLTKELMPQKGHTETFGLDDVSVSFVLELVEKLAPKVLSV